MKLRRSTILLLFLFLCGGFAVGQTGPLKRITTKTDKLDFGAGGTVAIIGAGTHDTKHLKQIAKKFPKRLIGLPFRIDYVIKVPRYCDLQLDNGIGDITVTGIEGSLRINSVESNARLDLVGGSVNGVFGKGTVTTTIPERSWRGSGIDLQLASGNLNVYMPVNLSAELDAAILRKG